VSYLVDTNIISELRKGGKCDGNVARWFASIDAAEIYLSVLVLGELRRGVEKLRRKDGVRALSLENWLSELIEDFSDRVLLVDKQVADEWGRMTARRSIPDTDALLAATAKVHGLTLATRNVADVSDLGADVLNPFTLAPR
jgi:predicted nucleic acid-binding protein